MELNTLRSYKTFVSNADSDVIHVISVTRFIKIIV